MSEDGGTGSEVESESDGDPLSEATCRRMVATVEESWDLDGFSVVDRGFNDVYFATVETGDGTRDCVLKVSDDTAEQIRAEARLQRLLADATEIPVPAVFGRVDGHPDLPAPFFLMERLDGDAPEGPPGEIPLNDLARMARQVGRHLGDLHAVDAADAFGWVRADVDVDAEYRPNETADSGERADGTANSGDGEDATAGTGARPFAREYGLTVGGATGSWPSFLRDLAEMHLRHHGDTRFGDRTADVRAAIDEGIEGLEREPPAVLGRIDHAFENYLVDPETLTVTGVLDWGMLRTVDPAYDLVWAEQSFAGLTALDSGRRKRVRAALREGYETRASVDVDAGARRLYLLVTLVARQNWVSEWIPADGADEIERDHRRLLDALV